MSAKLSRRYLKRYLQKREGIKEDIKNWNAELAEIDGLIMEYYDKLGIKEIDIGDKVYRKQVNQYVEWDSTAFVDWLLQKFSSKFAYRLCKPVIKKEYIVNEDAVREAIVDKKISTKAVKKFIDTRESRPFIRSYPIRKEE